MVRFLIFFLVVLLPLKSVAASYGICKQDVVAHEQQHAAQSGTSQHHQAPENNQLASNMECSDCTLCHTTCGAFVVAFNDGLLLPSKVSQSMQIDLAARLKAQPSDPPYRPKWSALA